MIDLHKKSPLVYKQNCIRSHQPCGWLIILVIYHIYIQYIITDIFKSNNITAIWGELLKMNKDN